MDEGCRDAFRGREGGDFGTPRGCSGCAGWAVQTGVSEWGNRFGGAGA
jgi:hypothetical protein